MWEDNAPCMKVTQPGLNPTMRHLHRVHGLSVRVLHEIVGKGRDSSFVDVTYTPIDDMRADICTNDFTSAMQCAHAVKYMSVVKQERTSDVSNRVRL